MALTWNWTDKVGTATYKFNFRGEQGEHQLSLYNGNALLIMLHEYEQDGNSMYDMFGFFVDKDHCKRCLGLVKDSKNIWETEQGTITEITLSKSKCKNFDYLVKAFAHAFKSIQINIVE